MKTMLLAASAAALLCATVPVVAQSAGSSMGGAGMLCSDLTAMDSAAQTAFLQGYSAGRHDAMMSAGGSAMGSTDSAAAGSTTTTGSSAGSGAASSTDTAAAGSATTGTAGSSGAAGSTDATATGSTASGNTAASGGAAAGAGGTMDFNAIMTACAGTPSSTLSDAMGGSAGTTSP